MGWNLMVETGFDWKSYPGECPVGEYEIVLDQVVYAKGGSAIHLFYKDIKQKKHWSLIYRKWPYDVSIYDEFKDSAKVGDRWQVKIFPALKSTHTWIGKAKRLAPSERDWVVSTTVQRHYKEKKEG